MKTDSLIKVAFLNFLKKSKPIIKSKGVGSVGPKPRPLAEFIKKHESYSGSTFKNKSPMNTFS